jgi:hypothetical protein
LAGCFHFLPHSRSGSHEIENAQRATTVLVLEKRQIHSLSLRYATMAARFGKLTLRDLFWLILLSAIAVGWHLERTRAAKQLAEFSVRWQWTANLPPQPDPSEPRRKLLKEFAALSNEELNARFIKTPPAKAFGSTDDYACCLIEMARRKMHAELQVHHDKLLTNKGEGFDWPANALLLTALRRAQGKPDPLQIDLELVTVLEYGQPESMDPKREIPGIKATLKNIDESPIFITQGGDYRSGRQTRWRVHLTNEKGQRIADSNFPQFGIGGGISGFGSLKPGEASRNPGQLDARSYVKSPPSGKYQLQVVYSEQEIAAESDLTGLIVWTSQPVPVEVTNRTRADEAQFSALPLVGILAIGGVAFAIVGIRQRRGDADTMVRSRLLNWRDAVALVLLVALTAGWIIDTQRLFGAIEERRPDREADWSMKVIDKMP